MTAITERVRQLAPHWAVMILVLFALFALFERAFGSIAFWQSLVIVAVIAFGYPSVVRYLGVAPEVWTSE